MRIATKIAMTFLAVATLAIALPAFAQEEEKGFWENAAETGAKWTGNEDEYERTTEVVGGVMDFYAFYDSTYSTFFHVIIGAGPLSWFAWTLCAIALFLFLFHRFEWRSLGAWVAAAIGARIVIFITEIATGMGGIEWLPIVAFIVPIIGIVALMWDKVTDSDYWKKLGQAGLKGLPGFINGTLTPATPDGAPAPDEGEGRTRPNPRRPQPDNPRPPGDSTPVVRANTCRECGAERGPRFCTNSRCPTNNQQAGRRAATPSGGRRRVRRNRNCND